MIMMALDLQKEMLDSLAASRPHDLQFAADLNKIYEEVEKEEESRGELGGWLPRPRAAQARCRRAAIRLLEGLL